MIAALFLVLLALLPFSCSYCHRWRRFAPLAGRIWSMYSCSGTHDRRSSRRPGRQSTESISGMTATTPGHVCWMRPESSARKRRRTLPCAQDRRTCTVRPYRAPLIDFGSSCSSIPLRHPSSFACCFLIGTGLPGPSSAISPTGSIDRSKSLIFRDAHVRIDRAVGNHGILLEI
jgi:hypothetical protein